MEMKKLIVHQLSKVRAEKSEVLLREKELLVTDAATDLIRSIRQAHSNKSRAYGIFEPDVTLHPFSGYLRDYRFNNKRDFVQFSTASMDSFKDVIDPVTFATGGYVLFCHYTDEAEYLLVVMLNDVNGTTIDAQTLEIKRATHLDVSQLHLAVRINISLWNAGDDKKYLSFLKGRSGDQEIAGYFRRFIGCSEYTGPKDETQKLLKAVNDYCKEKNYSEDERYMFRERVYLYCNERRRSQRPVYLEHLSTWLDSDNPDQFFLFCNDEGHAVSSEFEIHAATLRNLWRYSGRSKHLSVSFDANVLGKDIVYDSGKKELLIKKIPQSLLTQLEEDY